MEYIAILEKKVERGEIFVLYCQWTGNEAELEKLAKAMESTNQDPEDHMTTFTFSRQRFPEAVVDLHLGITEFQVSVWKDMGDGDNFEDVSLPMFTKCSGTFVFPEKAFQKSMENEFRDEEEEEEEAGESDRALALDYLFSGCRLKNYFTA
jgi:hypothetical protein